MRNRIHIVSFDMPVPPNYGGVWDVYMRAKALKRIGYYIVLHCYEYGRGRNHDFSDIADEVYCYDRQTGLRSLLSTLPYIVRSRNSRELLNRLEKDNYPILFEGQHSTFWAHKLKGHRLCVIRMHNVEWLYYQSLSRHSSSFLKSCYFRVEAWKLKRHERSLKQFPLLCISRQDEEYYRSEGFHPVYLPPTISSELILPRVEEKSFALYHGDLSVSANQQAVYLLIKENKRLPLPIPVVVAGRNPPPGLIAKIEEQNWDCVANPTDDELNELLSSCSMHLLIGFKATGTKLKVIRALLSGKPSIATSDMVEDSVLARHCLLWDPNTPLANRMTQTSALNEDNFERRMKELDDAFGIQRLQAVMREIGF